LKGSRISGVGRRGKFILIDLDSGKVLVVHLRMTGKFLVLTPDDPLPPHAHAVFYLDDERRLVFRDQRQFGVMKLVANSRLLKTKGITELAPEPFSDEFSVGYLRETLARSRRTLKTLLLDQTRVVGLGNIYAAEALFRAGINPFKTASGLSALLVHGAMDDNVHMQNTMQFVYELQKAGKQFELMVYPKSRHGVTDPLLVKHMRTMMTDFIVANL
jgi:formamidopyrimidine-DNA glycosylase